MVETTDILVIGGGVFGLSAARACAVAGHRVILCEAAQIGATDTGAASGGLVGALVPHRPERWRDFKHFQLDALLDLPGRVAALAAETGIDPGYEQVGRLSPLTLPDQRCRAHVQAEAASRNWRGAGRLEVLDRVPHASASWLAPDACPHGVVHDTLSARINPLRYLDALAASLADRAEIRPGWRCIDLDGATATARFQQGKIAAGRVVLAAGTGTFDLLERLTGARWGSGVKGQAALLAATASRGAPVIQGDGIFVVAHGPDAVAVGSTSETHWDKPGCDQLLDELLGRARKLCPPLAEAKVLARWAGIRPKAARSDPLVGALPGWKRIILATGGYKIGFGIAHLVGDAVASFARDETPRLSLPAAFEPRLPPAPAAG